MRSSRLLLFSLVAFQTCPQFQLTNYYIYATEYLQDCPGYGNLSIWNFFDQTHLNVTWTEEGCVLVNGYITVMANFDPTKVYYLQVSVEKYIFERWYKQAYDIQREDLCAHPMSSDDIWYRVFEDFKGDQLLCPPQKGVIYKFQNKTFESHILEGPPGIEGDYRGTIAIASSSVVIMCSLIEVKCVKDCYAIKHFAKDGDGLFYMQLLGTIASAGKTDFKKHGYSEKRSYEPCPNGNSNKRSY